MALLAKSLRVVNNLSNDAAAAAPSNTPRLVSYATADALATVTAAGYFNGAADQLMPGDVLLIQHSVGGTRGVALRTVQSIAAGVVTIAALG